MTKKIEAQEELDRLGIIALESIRLGIYQCIEAETWSKLQHLLDARALIAKTMRPPATPALPPFDPRFEEKL